LQIQHHENGAATPRFKPDRSSSRLPEHPLFVCMPALDQVLEHLLDRGVRRSMTPR